MGNGRGERDLVGPAAIDSSLRQLAFATDHVLLGAAS